MWQHGSIKCCSLSYLPTPANEQHRAVRAASNTHACDSSQRKGLPHSRSVTKSLSKRLVCNNLAGRAQVVLSRFNLRSAVRAKLSRISDQGLTPKQQGSASRTASRISKRWPSIVTQRQLFARCSDADVQCLQQAENLQSRHQAMLQQAVDFMLVDSSELQDKFMADILSLIPTLVLPDNFNATASSAAFDEAVQSIHQGIKLNRRQREHTASIRLLEMQFEAMEEWAEMANMDWIEFPPMSREEVEFKSTLAWYDFKRATELSASLADSLAQAGATDVLSNMTGLPLTLADLDPTVTAMAGQDADCSSGSPAKQGLTMCNAAAISIAISTAINDALSPCLSRLSVFSHEWTAQYDDLKDQIVYAEEQVAACKVNTHSANNTASLPVVEGDDKTVELEQLYKRLNILQCNALRQVQANAILDVDTTLQQLKSDLEHIKRVARNSKQPIDVAMSSVDEGNADQGGVKQQATKRPTLHPDIASFLPFTCRTLYSLKKAHTKKELQIGAPMTKRTVMMPVTAALQEELHIVAYQAKLFHSNVQLLVQAMDNRREELKAQLQDVKIWIHEHDEQSSLPTPWQDDQLAVTC